MKGYTKIPNKVFSMYPALSTIDIALFGFLFSLPEEFNPSILFISGKLSISRNTVKKHMAYLCSRGMIKKYKQGSSKKASLYEFRPMKEWK